MSVLREAGSSHPCLPGSPKRKGPPVSSGIWVGSHLNSEKPHLLLPVKIITGRSTHHTLALIDSGAEQNLINHDLAKTLKLPLTPLSLPIPVSALNDKVFATITHQTAPVHLVISGNHQVSLFTFPLPDTQFILGFSWLQKHNPVIEWSENKIISWSLFCLASCLKSTVPGGKQRQGSLIPSPPPLRLRY